MNTGRPSRLLLAGITLLLMGCTAATPGGASSSTSADGSAPAAPVVIPPAATPSGGVSVTGIPGDLLNAILDDAVERSGLPTDSLIVTRAESVTWNDGSLGCPEPGMFYTQALVNGYQIVVDAEGRALDYRVQDNGLFRLCEQILRGGNRP